MNQNQENQILAAASVYNEKYFINPDFKSIPQQVRDEIQYLCIKTAKDLHCIFTIGFKPNGDVVFTTQGDQTDKIYNENFAEKKVTKIIDEKAGLIQSLNLWYKVFVLKEIPDTETGI